MKKSNTMTINSNTSIHFLNLNNISIAYDTKLNFEINTSNLELNISGTKDDSLKKR